MASKLALSESYENLEVDGDTEDMQDITDHVVMQDEPLAGGVYNMAIASVVRDTRRLAVAAQQDDEYPTVRLMRLIVSLAIVYLLIGLQFWLTIETKRLVSPMSVHDIREVYGKYEMTMYTDAEGVEHVWYNSVGKPRGTAGHFNASNFDLLTEDEKDTVCMIPMSKPSFTLVILFIWAITCMGEIRAVANLMREMWRIPSVASMADSLSFDDLDVDAGEARLVGLTCCWRYFLIFFVLLPRCLLTLFLLWLGCRWLLATTGFADLLLNSIALEFILLLRETLYNVLVPLHTKKETEGTLIPSRTESRATCGTYFNTLSLAVIAMLFVLTYFYGWQQVLPSYQWDVRATCEEYLAKRMKV